MTESWLSPTNKILWMQAFKTRATKVTLKDGRVFIVEYRQDTAFVKPQSGFVPRGEFPLSRVTHESWLTQIEKEHGTTGGAQTKVSIYSLMMKDFVMSRHKGVDVAEHWPEVANRQPATLRQAFLRARLVVLSEDKRARAVDVINREGKVYLIKEGSESNGAN